MPNVEQHEVHIQNLYKRIDELDKDCQERDKKQLEATLRVHDRIDDFTSIMIQLSELVKDVQATMAHQKAMESKIEVLDRRLIEVKQVADSAAEVTGWVKKGIGVIVLAVIGGLLALLGLKN